MDIDEVVNMLHTNLVFTSCGRSRYDWRGGHNRPRPVLSPHLEEKKKKVDFRRCRDNGEG